MFVLYTIRRILNRKLFIFLLFLTIALTIYFFTIRSQGEAGPVSIGIFNGKPLIAIPARYDGAVAWGEAAYVTDVPTNTPIPSLTPTRDKTRRPTKTPTPTPSITPTHKPTKTKGPSPTPTYTYTPTYTPTTHAYFAGYTQPFNVYDTFGSSNAVDFLTIGNRLYLVIADGDQGLQIIETTSSPASLVSQYALKEAYGVKIIGTTAYIAAGKDGVVILDLTNPTQPITIDQRKTAGPALDLDVAYRYETTEDPATGLPRQYLLPRIYVAMGEDGMQVVNLYPIDIDNENHNSQKKSFFNKSYRKPVLLKSGDEALAVTGSHQANIQELVFVADGKNGVHILNLSNALDQPIREQDVVRILDVPYAWDVAFGKLLEHRQKNDKQIFWLFIATGKAGVMSYKVDFGDNPSLPSFTPFKTIDTPGEARTVTLYHNNVFVGDGEGGLEVIDFNDPDHPKLLGNGRYEFDWTQVPVKYAYREWFKNNVDSPGSSATVAFVLLDGLLCIGSLLLVMIIVSGMIFPTRSIMGRLQVMRRIFANLLNLHGPVRVIEDGSIRYQTPKEQLHGVGVTLQDANSAVLLDRHRNRRRVTGAQLTFTGRDEHVIFHTELRRRQLVIGPRETDPDPFQTRDEQEARALYRARQDRRQRTSARTSDDTEIVPRLRIVYSRQGAEPDERNEFGYGPQVITNAVQGDNPPAINDRVEPNRYFNRRQAVETRLERLACELWKLGVSRCSLAEIFPPLTDQDRSGALVDIQEMIENLFVRNQTTVLDNFQDAPNITALREDYREIFGGAREWGSTPGSQPDPGRGVRVHQVSIDALYLAEDDLRGVLWQWIDDWRAGNPPPQADLDARDAQGALVRFAEYAVQHLRDRPQARPLSQRLVDTLVSLLCGTLKALSPGSPEYERLQAIIRKLGGECP